MRERRIPFICPERSDQVQHRRAKGSRGGRPPAFDQAIYAGRHVVERCFNRLKQSRDLATRYAKRAAYYRVTANADDFGSSWERVGRARPGPFRFAPEHLPPRPGGRLRPIDTSPPQTYRLMRIFFV